MTFLPIVLAALCGLCVGWVGGITAFHYAYLLTPETPIDARLLWRALRRTGQHCAPAKARWLAGFCAVVLALTYAGLFAYVGGNLSAVGLAWAASVLLWLAFIDAYTRLLPDALTLPLLWTGLAWALPPVGRIPVHTALLAVMVAYGVLWLVAFVFLHLRGRDGMGGGDIKLLAAIGAWTGWPDVFLVLLCASVTGLLYALLVARGKAGAQHPFGPHLAVAALLVLGLRVLGVGEA